MQDASLQLWNSTNGSKCFLGGYERKKKNQDFASFFQVMALLEPAIVCLLMAYATAVSR